MKSWLKRFAICYVFVVLGAALVMPLSVNATENNAGGEQTTETKKMEASAIRLDGAASANYECVNGNFMTGNPVTSHLVDLGAGKYMRVEATSSGILVEEYSEKNKMTSRKILKQELAIYGGFFAGKDHYYLVFGQKNPKQSNSKEVIRVVKYTKKWKRVSACKVKNVDTYYPFYFASLRMTETDNILYLHTGKLMYATKWDNGVHHQDNLTVAIDKSTMKATHIVSGFMSHSLNQYIKADENYLFRVDHGDSGYRGVTIIRSLVDVMDSSAEYKMPLAFAGEDGNNATGATIDGVELSTNNVIVAGTHSNHDETMSGHTNVYVVVQGKDFQNNGTVKYITDYEQYGRYSAFAVKLVKLEDTKFLLMWRERDFNKDTISTKMVLMDENANLLGKIVKTDMEFSDCQPVLLSNGMVAWYVTTGFSPILYQIDPDHLGALKKKYPVSSSDIYRAVTGEIYKINKKKKTAKLTGVHKSVTNCTVEKGFSIGNTYYTVKQIGPKAFAKATKLKKITIKTTKLTSSGLSKTAFKGVKKKVTIKVPKSKLSAYKKLFRKKGLSKQVKVKKK